MSRLHQILERKAHLAADIARARDAQAAAAAGLQQCVAPLRIGLACAQAAAGRRWLRAAAYGALAITLAWRSRASR